MNKKKEPINLSSLLLSIVALVIGIFLCLNGGDAIFEIIGYIISGLLLLVGTIKIIKYVFSKRKNNGEFSDILSGVILICFGILIFMFPKFVPVTISLIIGSLVLFNGVNRLILGLAIKTIDKEGSKVFLLASLAMIFLGVLIITQKLMNLLGFFLVIYALSEMVGYIYYTSKNKDYSEVLNKKIPNDIKEKEAKEAIIEE
jgi:hypothetical protein